LPDSPFLKFRQLVELRFEHLEYGTVTKPDRWDGNDPQDELCRIFGSRELFAEFVDTNRLETILLAEKEINDSQLQEELRHVVRRPRRRNLPQETKLIFTNSEIVNNVLVDAVLEYWRDYRLLFLLQAKEEQEAVTSMSASDRRAVVDKYIDDVYRLTGKRVTRTQIWKKAGYTTRTEFERWQRQDPRATSAAHDKFMKLLLQERPDLK
jgi:hypothetical protein